MVPIDDDTLKGCASGWCQVARQKSSGGSAGGHTSGGGGDDEVKTDGVGGKQTVDKYKRLDTSTTPQDICDMLVKFGSVHHVQSLSAFTSGAKGETVSNKWEFKNRHWGPWDRSF